VYLSKVSVLIKWLWKLMCSCRWLPSRWKQQYSPSAWYLYTRIQNVTS
jgi:hypothetical protein